MALDDGWNWVTWGKAASSSSRRCAQGGATSKKVGFTKVKIGVEENRKFRWHKKSKGWF
jgi:hypothetical protein